MAHVRAVARRGGVTAFEVRWREDGAFRQRTFATLVQAEAFAVAVTRATTAPHGRRQSNVVMSSAAVAAMVTVEEVATEYLTRASTRLRPGCGPEPSRGTPSRSVTTSPRSSGTSRSVR